MNQAEKEISEFKSCWRELANQQAQADLTLEEQRKAFDEMNAAIPLPEGCHVTPIDTGKVRGELLTPSGADKDKAILYHHGGGYTFGSALSHRHMVARIAEAAGAVAYNMDYPLSPEAAYPCALNNAVDNYSYLLDQGYNPEQIVVAGESAGGNLTTALLLKLREMGKPLPVACYLLSPWLDLTQSGDSYENRKQFDPMVSREILSTCAQAYCNDQSPLDPLISPLKADLANLPPILIQVGTDEVLLSDSLDFTSKIAFQGGDIRLNVWPGMVHAWPLFHTALPTAGIDAIREAGDWINSRLSD